MATFFQQIFAILSSEPGSLTYQLVLAFSIAAALQASYTHWRDQALPEARRQVVGLVALLILRMVPFLFVGLASQGLAASRDWYPAVDRVVNLLSLVIIIWLWAFPEPSRSGDAATILIGLLVITAFSLGAIWFAGQGNQAAFNGSFPDTIGEVFALLLLFAGALLLMIRRPLGWIIGLLMLGILFVGHLYYLLFPDLNGNYPSPVRLAQMAAFPLLFFLPSRLSATSVNEIEPPPPPLEIGKRKFDPHELKPWLYLALERSPEKLTREITRMSTRAMEADLGLFIAPPNPVGHLAILAVYELARDEFRPGALVDGRAAPGLTAALRHGKPLRLTAGSGSPEQAALRIALSLPRSGHTMLVPIIPEDGVPLGSIVLFRLTTAEAWSTEDQVRLGEILSPLAAVLLRAREAEGLQAELASQRQASQSLQEQLLQLQEEKQDLSVRLEQVEPGATGDAGQAVEMATAIALLTSKVEQLQAEKDQLQASATTSPPPSADVVQLEGELRLALEEIAAMRASLALADQRQLEMIRSDQPSMEHARQMQAIASITQELRQPLSSIVGYTDFLLGESVGILGTLQRKFLDRIKVSTERLSRLVDDLVAQISQEAIRSTIAPQQLQLAEVVTEAVACSQDALQEKQLALQVEIPSALPELKTDRDLLQQILVHLLANAGAASPQQGGVSVQARLESSEGRADYVLIQVADSGDGIPPADLPRVFSKLYRPPYLASKTPNGLDLSQIKAMVETVGGRIWVDSQVGRGSTFSVLLPVQSPSLDSPNGSGGLDL
jgi:signal transduction histidine kinase